MYVFYLYSDLKFRRKDNTFFLIMQNFLHFL